ncbi:MAG: type II toxin-antitoxin system RelE/ParE family toxin [Elusimicrobiota bacterium]
MAPLRWSPQSVEDLESICQYISRDSDAYACLFAQNVVALIEDIARFPFSGRMVPEYQNPQIREKLFQNYRIVYRAKKHRIEIVGIVHGAQNFTAALRSRI